MSGPAESKGVALVTGAARGIGAETARTLSERGWEIAAADIRGCDEVVAEIGGAGGHAVGYGVDVTEWDEVRALVERIESTQGPISTLASVAGVGDIVKFLDLDPESWARDRLVNLDGTFHVCHAVATAMAPRRRGSIVCVASTASQLAWVGLSHYSASKAGVLGLVRGMALELGQFNIRVNAVCPGTIRTPLTREHLDQPEILRAEEEATPLGRVGEPFDIAEAIAFLTDSELSGWITGESLVVDGGYSTHGGGATSFQGDR